MKKLISMVLVCSLLISLLTIPVGAETNKNKGKNEINTTKIQQIINKAEEGEKETFSEAKKTEIEDILTCLGEKGFDLDIVSINRIEADGTVIYEEKFSEDFSSYFRLIVKSSWTLE